MKKLLSILAIFLVISCSSEEPEVENCNCEKKYYMYQPAIITPVIQIPPSWTYIRSEFNQCGTTSTQFENESGSDYNKVKYFCE
jgi:hypothetical protein